jgi:hypothetical protein
MFHVLRKSVLPDAKQRLLTRAELDRSIYTLTSVTVPRSIVDIIVAAGETFAGTLTGGTPGALALSSSNLDWLLPSSDIPRPTGIIERTTARKTITKGLATRGIVFAVGATGVGKSLLARDSAEAFAGDFVLVDLRDATSAESHARLNGILGRLGSTSARALLIEDLNHIEDPTVLRTLGAIITRIRRMMH